MTDKPMTDAELQAITAASAGFRGLFVHLPATGNVVFSPRDNDELHTIAEDLEPHVAEPLVVMLEGVPRLLAEVERLTLECDEMTAGRDRWFGVAEDRAAELLDHCAAIGRQDAEIERLKLEVLQLGTDLDSMAARETAPLRAEVERLWRHAGADGIDRMADHLSKAQGDVARLTQELDAARQSYRWEMQARAGCLLEWDGAMTLLDSVDVPRATDQRDALTLAERVEILKWERDEAAGRLRDEREAHADELESIAPHVRDSETEPDASVLAAPHRCDCCSATIPAGDSAVMFEDENGRACWAHYARCPEPEMWRIEWTYSSGDTGSNRPLELGEAYAHAVDFRRRYPGMPSIRLVRVRKEASRG